jgi:hypothetical protein
MRRAYRRTAAVMSQNIGCRKTYIASKPLRGKELASPLASQGTAVLSFSTEIKGILHELPRALQVAGIGLLTNFQ